MSWRDVAAARYGVVTRAQLREAGLSDDAISRLIRGGALVRFARGVFLVGGVPPSQESRLWVAVLATNGVIGFGTAARLWGLTPEAPSLLDVITRPTRRPTVRKGVRVHRVFVPAGAIRHQHGLPVTSRTWTLLDQIGRLRFGEACALADRALQPCWLTRQDISQRISRHPSRSGNRQLREILTRSGDRAAAESERMLHGLLRQAGIRGWIANYPIDVDGTLIAKIDVAFPSARIAIEIDGWAYHSDVERFQGDRQRQNSLVSLGWTVLRFTWADLSQRPGYVIATIRRQLIS